MSNVKFYRCKYRTGSKKVLQIKNRFWRFLTLFLSVFHRKILPQSSFRASLLSKRTTFAMQKDSFWRARKPLLHCKCSPFEIKRTFFCTCSLRILLHIRVNTLSMSDISLMRSKLTNFEPKIFLCVQLAVLSGQKCKYCVGAKHLIVMLRC